MGTGCEDRRLFYRVPVTREVVRLLEDMLDSITSSPDEELNYWDWASAANIKLCLLMLGDKAPGHKAPVYEGILEEFKNTWDKAGSIGKKLGEIEYFDFLSDALALSKKRNATILKSKIDTLRDELEKMI